MSLSATNEPGTYSTSIKASLPDSSYQHGYYKWLLDYLVVPCHPQLQAVRRIELSSALLSSQPQGSHTASDGAAPHRATLCVAEGFLSPSSIEELGKLYRLRPELFIGHLRSGQERPTHELFFELPTLPTRRSNVLHVTLVSLTTIEPEQEDTSLVIPSSIRSELVTATSRHQALLFKHRSHGETYFRSIHFCDPKHILVEQMVSFSFSDDTSSAGWTGVFLLDKGRTLRGTYRLPWARFTKYGQFPSTLIPPGYNDAVRAPSKGPYTSVKPNKEVELDSDLHPYHPFAAYTMIARDELEKDCKDPFRIVGRLFKAASLSWAQILNFLETDVARSSNCAVEFSATALEQLRFCTTLLDRFRVNLQDDLEAIETRCSLPYFSDRPDDELQRQLIKDYRYLISQADRLEHRCAAASSILVSSMGVLESQKSITEAEEVTKLSRLAFVFIPMSFAASVFGMNVWPVALNPSIWYFILVAFVLTVLSMCFMLWPSRYRIIRRLRILLRKRQGAAGQ